MNLNASGGNFQPLYLLLGLLSILSNSPGGTCKYDKMGHTVIPLSHSGIWGSQNSNSQIEKGTLRSICERNVHYSANSTDVQMGIATVPDTGVTPYLESWILFFLLLSTSQYDEPAWKSSLHSTLHHELPPQTRS